MRNSRLERVLRQAAALFRKRVVHIPSRQHGLKTQTGTLRNTFMDKKSTPSDSMTSKKDSKKYFPQAFPPEHFKRFHCGTLMRRKPAKKSDDDSDTK